LKNILITGGSGFFATNFTFQFEKKYNIFLLGNKRKIKLRKLYFINLNNRKQIKRLIIEKKIDTLIHAAAITDVDYCERNKKKCFAINSNLSIKLSNLSKQCGIKFVFISSDQVFSRNKKFKSEKSIPNPINNYAKSKVKAEREILKNNKNAIIIRTNFFGYGPKYRRSFSDWILDSILKRKKIKLYDDIFFNPLYIRYLNKLLINLIKKNMKGIYNFSSDDKISKYQFGIKIAKLFNLDLSLIEKSKFDSKNHSAIRPKNMCLNNTKIKKILKIKNINVNDQLKKMHKERIQK